MSPLKISNQEKVARSLDSTKNEREGLQDTNETCYGLETETVSQDNWPQWYLKSSHPA